MMPLLNFMVLAVAIVATLQAFIEFVHAVIIFKRRRIK